MIYLYTGANGTCKTLFTLKDVRDLQVKDSRPVYFVEGRFKPKPILTEEFGWKPFQFKDWQTLPSGSIILCDEVHEDLPKRSPSSAVPEHIKAIAQHRARGYDFFMMTQHPANIDNFVTRIIGAPGWHRHLKRVAGGSSVTSMLQWDAVNNVCEKAGSGKTAQITVRSQPKEVYNWYDSAELHTAKLRIPKSFIYLVVSLPIIVFLFWLVVQMLLKKNGAKKDVDQVGTVAMVAPGQGPGRDRPLTPWEYAGQYKPRLENLMHTAPVYDELTKPKRVPVAAACIQSASKGCKCFTQDATPYPLDQAMCKALLEHGTFYAFDPDPDRKQPQQQQVATGSRPAMETAIAAPGVLSAPSSLPANMQGVSMQVPSAPSTPAQQPAPEPQRIASVRR